ncbi:hypothetical protein ACHAXR_001165, partial [Thalassiosira sp. AJA248-18]
ATDLNRPPRNHNSQQQHRLHPPSTIYHDGLLSNDFTDFAAWNLGSCLDSPPCCWLRVCQERLVSSSDVVVKPSVSLFSVKETNEASTTSAHFSPEELVAMTKDYIANPSPDWWSDDEFVFRGPVIGPLVKKDLLATLGANEDLRNAFPDLQANAFGFTADDPIEPDRVWFFVRPRGTFQGDFKFPGSGKIIEATGAPYIGPPECRSVVFNAEGKIKYQTVGYVVDRFTGDTTGGRGAIFGQYAVMGQEIDANPGAFSTVFLQKLSEYLPNFPKSYSKREDLPAWWKDERVGAEL